MGRTKSGFRYSITKWTSWSDYKCYWEVRWWKFYGHRFIVGNINSVYKNVALQTLKLKKRGGGTDPPTNPGRLGLRNLGCLTTV